MPSIEELWAKLDQFFLDYVEPDAFRRAQAAARALALAELESYVDDVDRVAEADVIAGNPLEGAHYRAMRTVAVKHRARIEQLGKEGT